MHRILNEIAKDCIKVYQSSHETIFTDSIKELVPCRKQKSFTQEDIIKILRATISHGEEIKNHNYDGWLEDCGFQAKLKNVVYRVCSGNLTEIARHLIDRYQNNTIQPEVATCARVLRHFCEILSA